MDIFIYDEFEPEAIAMMQALYSRSSESVVNHAKRVEASGSSKFMESYYVGYGHSSIGDCGTTSIFIENVSILAAKTVQDNPLYSGQETSTRYIDFSKQGYYDPVKSEKSKKILDNWFNFYETNINIVIDDLKKKFPNKDNNKLWDKAIKARAFDILRGFLPVAAKTQLSWSTNLRQANDKITQMKHHPLSEVRSIASNCINLLKDKYPSSFSHKDANLVNPYLMYISEKSNYSDYPNEKNSFSFSTDIENSSLESNESDVISKRPRGISLPKYLSKYGRYSFKFSLDYGSFRDLQRHRNGMCQIPILNGNDGFNDWYISNLPDSIKNKAKSFISSQINDIDELRKHENINAYELQYFFPMGMNVNCEVIYDLSQAVYVTELRSGKTVHPTLRRIAHKFYNVLHKNHPLLNLYVDSSEDDFCMKRGSQDIEKK